MPAAANACRMKSNSNMMTVLVALQLEAARHHEDPALVPQPFDVGDIEPRERGTRDDHEHGAECCAAVGEIEDPIDRVEKRIELVRGEEHGHRKLALNPPHELHDAALMVRIEADQRLIEQQTLPLAARKLGEHP